MVYKNRPVLVLKRNVNTRPVCSLTSVETVRAPDAVTLKNNSLIRVSKNVVKSISFFSTLTNFSHTSVLSLSIRQSISPKYCTLESSENAVSSSYDIFDVLKTKSWCVFSKAGGTQSVSRVYTSRVPFLARWRDLIWRKCKKGQYSVQFPWLPSNMLHVPLHPGHTSTCLFNLSTSAITRI